MFFCVHMICALKGGGIDMLIIAVIFDVILITVIFVLMNVGRAYG